MMQERIILGVDPGTVIMGYAVVKQAGQKVEVLTADVLKLNTKKSQQDRLKTIFETALALIKKYKPDELAIEGPYYAKNPQAMLKLGRAEGVVMAAALAHTIPSFEYSPRKIKQAITGNGSSSKLQVALMLQKMSFLDEIPKYMDASDGLAVAVCHLHQKKFNHTDTRYSDWNSFLRNNPDRISG